MSEEKYIPLISIDSDEKEEFKIDIQVFEEGELKHVIEVRTQSQF